MHTTPQQQLQQRPYAAQQRRAGEVMRDGIQILTIFVRNQWGAELSFRVKSTTTMETIMKAACDKWSIELTAMRFVFNSVRLFPDETVGQRQMEDGDVIDALMNQTGC